MMMSIMPAYDIRLLTGQDFSECGHCSASLCLLSILKTIPKRKRQTGLNADTA